MIEKEQRVQLEALLQAGVPKREIFVRLGKTDDLASALVNAPHPRDRERFAKLNWFLVSLLIYLSVSKIIVTTANIVFLKLPVYLFFLGLFYPIAFFYVAWLVKKYQGGSYAFAAGISLMYLGNNVNAYLSKEHAQGSLVFASVLIAAATAFGLSMYLRSRLCPQAGFLGAKTDSEGQYLFLKDG